MGRLDANTMQYHQGHQELPEIINDAPPPPPFHEENHEPPSEFQKPVKPNKNVDHEPRSPKSSEAQHFPPPPNQPHSFPPPLQSHENVTQAFPPPPNQPHSFPPPHQSHENVTQAFPLPPNQPHSFPPHQSHENVTQAFPPPPNQPHSFPPPHQSHENVTQAFPPPYEETTPQSFPQGKPNVGMQFHQQPNVGMQFQPQGFHHQSNAGGVQMGHPMVAGNMPSPLPFIPNGGQMPNQLPNQAWKSDLFDCMKDPQNAIITMFFPCVTFGQIAEIVDSGNSSCAMNGIMYWAIAFCIWMPCILSCTYRTKLRSKFRLIESPAPDWAVHFLYEPCALCQEYRELKYRNLDPSIGWVGNVAKQQQMIQFATAPPMQQRMM